MVHWVYVLECCDRNIYVGETTRLYSRFSEHIGGRGSVNTSSHSPRKLIGLYKVDDNHSFFKYRDSILKKNEYNRFIIEDWGNGEGSGNLDIENHITELYFHLRNKEDDIEGLSSFRYNDGMTNKVNGGKYTKMFNRPTFVDNDYILDRPCCDCMFPCEVKISKDKKTIYFVCSVKNIWEGFDSKGLQIEGPCDFYKVYTEDMYIKKAYEVNIESKLKESWVSNIPVSLYKIHPEPCVMCKKTNYLTIFAFTKVRRLCQECMMNKYDELKKEYSSSPGRCLMVD
jgi:predicted GIY-YIG superfamily endonuclease